MYALRERRVHVTQEDFELAVAKVRQRMELTPVAYFTKQVNPSLAKPPLKFNGGLAKLGLTSLLEIDTQVLPVWQEKLTLIEICLQMNLWCTCSCNGFLCRQIIICHARSLR